METIVPPDKCDEPALLTRKVQILLKEDGRSLPEIYKQSGIPFYWLKKFVNGGIKSPSVNRVEYLYTFLTGKDLAL